MTFVCSDCYRAIVTALIFPFQRLGFRLYVYRPPFLMQKGQQFLAVSFELESHLPHRFGSIVLDSTTLGAPVAYQYVLR